VVEVITNYIPHRNYAAILEYRTKERKTGFRIIRMNIKYDLFGSWDYFRQEMLPDPPQTAQS
jgi:hypothetical protein